MVSDNKEKAGILFVNPWTSLYGGSNVALYLLIKHLNREIFHPVVVLPDKGPLWDRLQKLDVPIHISPLKPWFNLHGDSASAALSWLADLPERVQRIMDAVYHWDIKIVHSSVMSILEGALAAKLTGVPHICTGQTNHFAYTWSKNIISPSSVYEMLNSLSHTIVPVSSSVKEVLDRKNDRAGAFEADGNFRVGRRKPYAAQPHVWACGGQKCLEGVGSASNHICEAKPAQMVPNRHRKIWSGRRSGSVVLTVEAAGDEERGSVPVDPISGLIGIHLPFLRPCEEAI